ncbi:MAG TPA: hypothetical protein VHX15_06825 [Frankiaceae bacterium]|nr:hypothetical protein [Frankiaceae bacterium]
MTLASLGLAGCSASGRSMPPITASSYLAATPISAALLVKGAAFLTISSESGRGFSLQLRAINDGHTLGTVFRSASSTTSLEAAAEPDGSVLAAQNGHCSSTLLRLNLAAGRQQVIRRIPEEVSDMVLNPSGTKIAYLAQRTCSHYTCPSSCAGPAGFLPNVLVVMDVLTGRSSRTGTDTAGHPLMNLTWSPDGTQIAAAYYGNTTKLLRFNASAPDFAAATAIAARTGCEYIATTWTRSGLISAEACGRDLSFSPGRLVETTPTGAIRNSWRLPDCVNGLSLASTPNGMGTLVQVDIGYGDGACATAQADAVNPLTRIAMIDGTRLRTVIELRDGLAVNLAGY